MTPVLWAAPGSPETIGHRAVAFRQAQTRDELSVSASRTCTYRPISSGRYSKCIIVVVPVAAPDKNRDFVPPHGC
jgi:hypothetical protein